MHVTMLACKLNCHSKRKIPNPLEAKMLVKNQNISQEKNPEAMTQKADAALLNMKDGVKRTSSLNADTSKLKEDGTSHDNTSKYLKVLTRIEGLLTKDALPEVAIKGFVGAVKKQLDQLSQSEKQGLMKLPEIKALDLKNLEEIPEKIEETLADTDSAKGILKLLKNPRFASLMNSEDKGSSTATYKPTALKQVPTKMTVDSSETTSLVKPSQDNIGTKTTKTNPIPVSPG